MNTRMSASRRPTNLLTERSNRMHRDLLTRINAFLIVVMLYRFRVNIIDVAIARID